MPQLIGGRAVIYTHSSGGTDEAFITSAALCAHIGILNERRSAQASETKTYAYDALGRLVGIVASGGSATTMSIYSFNPASNRQWTAVTQADGTKLPIFRFSKVVKHLYTVSYLEGQQAGLSAEGVGFYLLPGAGSGRTPLYRCYYGPNEDRFLSVQSNCEGAAQEGRMGYAYSSPAIGLVPLYRFYSSANTDHLVTARYSEGTSCCAYEGILGYVPQ